MTFKGRRDQATTLSQYIEKDQSHLPRSKSSSGNTSTFHTKIKTQLKVKAINRILKKRNSILDLLSEMYLTKIGHTATPTEKIDINTRE
jgi:hypothetical protein